MTPPFDFLHICLASQQLTAYAANQRVWQCAISSGVNGIGEQQGSGKTPRGWHRVRARIGDGLPVAAVLRGRRWTGEVLDARLEQAAPERDWILTRILWLVGLESGFNRGGQCDTFARYIYLHGTPDSQPMGVPRSHGCVRLHNHDMLYLFQHTPYNCLVFLGEHPLDQPALEALLKEAQCKAL
ncbi:L,D-transpeptidase [Atopomonas sediminilitoris]|uniref:L,D-transpeptidase n=1 Tax=Atopomonas sediminilitoris TaxID=2919919 RepID=UPI001F4E9E34|nr:L,D-transpeptidase [Atopomonas sediminilitoris]MCJ8167733.1 L,D-transpeptidase [Atopomonas sediminilitoris]